MKARRPNNYIGSFDDEGHDPLANMANLFDVAMVFAVALMVALVLRMQMSEFLTSEDVSFVKNAGKKNMEIIVKKNNKITRYQAQKKNPDKNGKGRRVGIAYQLDNGDIIYVPEE